jgi:hypothetical protein
MSEPTIIDNDNRSAEEDASIAVAETSRELDWKSKSFIQSIFMGDLDTSMCFPFPEQSAADKAIGDEICAKVDAWAAEHINGEEIDQTGTIPAPVLKGLNDFGLFGIKIPTKYGGLGLSQTNYMRILSMISLHCGSTAATLSAHQSIGVPQPLKLFGSEELKEKYLTQCAAGAITAFGLTEPTVGSDPANMTTTAELSEDGKHYILNGYKLWCTNSVIADLLVVMAKSGVDKRGSREINRISAFVVETRWAGVEILHQSRFMGLSALENGIVKFDNVKVPVENLIWGEGKGLRLALTTLNDGRLGIPAITAGALEVMADFSARWGKSRFQWGKNIGEHEAGAEKLAQIAGGAYAMSTMAAYGAALSDHGGVDLRMEAAAAKLFNTELGWDLCDTALQFRGGRGYETATSLEQRGDIPVPLERGMRDNRINRIVEGTTDIMHLFLAREALDKHLSMAMPLFTKKSTLGQKLSTLVKCGAFYSLWYPKLWIGGIFKSHKGFTGEWKKQVKWVDRRTRKLARTLFHLMALNGPKLEMRQLALARVVDIGTELGVMALVAARAQTAQNRGDKADLERASFFLAWARLRVDALFHQLSNNVDKEARKVAESFMLAAEALPEPMDLSELSPLTEREFGTDLTSGRQAKRLVNGGKPPTSSQGVAEAS